MVKATTNGMYRGVDDQSSDYDLAASVSNSHNGRNSKPIVKSLFDSEYVVPDKNTKVFQDSHPNKNAVF